MHGISLLSSSSIVNIVFSFSYSLFELAHWRNRLRKSGNIVFASIIVFFSVYRDLAAGEKGREITSPIMATDRSRTSGLQMKDEKKDDTEKENIW